MLFHRQQRQRRHGLQFGRQRVQRGVQRVDAGQQLVQVATGQQRLRIQRATGEQHLLGGGQAQPIDEAPQAAGVEMQADARGRHEHLDGRRAEPEVTGERQISRATVNTTVQPGDRDRPRRLERVGQFTKAGAGIDRAQRAQIEAAAEVPALANQDQHAHRRVRIHFIEQLAQHVQVVGRKPVGLPWPPQRDAGRGAVHLKHGRQAGTHARSSPAARLRVGRLAWTMAFRASYCEGVSPGRIGRSAGGRNCRPLPAPSEATGRSGSGQQGRR
mmetsp:Transcript_87429/g.243437  ORF Transcript_87429/g.243437 Transcript_87429/m.243437 type:complete len:272 (+) Transcript_87429:652-1467(+)